MPTAETTVYFYTTTHAICSDGIAAGTGLLGQLGFFEFCAVTFLYSRGEITIRRARTRL